MDVQIISGVFAALVTSEGSGKLAAISRVPGWGIQLRQGGYDNWTMQKNGSFVLICLTQQGFLK